MIDPKRCILVAMALATLLSNARADGWVIPQVPVSLSHSGDILSLSWPTVSVMTNAGRTPNGEYAIFRGAIMRESIFRDSDFSVADFRSVNFSDSEFELTDFRFADFRGADMDDVTAWFCDFTGAQFWGPP
jgi:uncharacterized protein YjbI with pentapeptide repeats